MPRTKEKLLVIDTETANDITQPLPYDIGYAICDRNGKIYIKRSFVVAETFLDYKNKQLMNVAYYADKIPHYWDEIRANKRTLKSIFSIRKQIREDMRTFNVKSVGAYNMGFDKKALNNIIRYCSQSRIRWFFPFGTKYFCIWNMACQTVLNTVTYIKFAMKNNLMSKAGNVQTSAEACYKFLTGSPTFKENHTGLEDVEIEIDIMVKCYRAHKKMNKDINSFCWQLPQKKKKEFLLGLDKQTKSMV